jgi:hypothetical protein
MRSPLLSVRIEHSECGALLRGHQFDSITEFEASLRLAHSERASGRVAFVITWKDGATFRGLYDLDQFESVAEHAARVGRVALADPRLWCLAEGTCLTITRLFETALAERLSRASRITQQQGDAWGAV